MVTEGVAFLAAVDLFFVIFSFISSSFLVSMVTEGVSFLAAVGLFFVIFSFISSFLDAAVAEGVSFFGTVAFLRTFRQVKKGLASTLSSHVCSCDRFFRSRRPCHSCLLLSNLRDFSLLLCSR